MAGLEFRLLYHFVLSWNASSAILDGRRPRYALSLPSSFMHAHTESHRPDSYWSLYTVRADTSGIHKYEGEGIHGTYYMIVYDVVLIVEHAGLRAQIAWTEKVCSLCYSVPFYLMCH